MVDTGRKPYFATNYQDMMRHVYMKPKGHSEGRKPYMEDDYFDTEYPHLKKYNGRGIPPGTEPPIEPPIEPTECLEWFEKTILISGNDYYNNPVVMNRVYSELGLCEKLRLIINGCMNYNSVSFCICCAIAMMKNPNENFTYCYQDFGPVADEPWKCCSDPCPSFSIEVVAEDASTVCYKATADCDIRVSWEKKILNGPWQPMDGSGCTDKAICGGQVKATDLCGNEETKDLPGLATPTGTLSCSSSPCDEVVKSTTKQYTYIPCDCAFGDATWSVSGTGASIDQNGLLTTTASACGTLTITVTQAGCQPATQQVRVTDGGTWVLQSSSGIDCVSSQPISCDKITGGTKTTYLYANCGGGGSYSGCSPLDVGTCGGYSPTSDNVRGWRGIALGCGGGCSYGFNDYIPLPNGANDHCGNAISCGPNSQSLQCIKIYIWSCP